MQYYSATENEWSTNIQQNNESYKHAEQKKADTEENTLRFHLFEDQKQANLIYSDRKQNSSCLEPKVGVDMN